LKVKDAPDNNCWKYKYRRLNRMEKSPNQIGGERDLEILKTWRAKIVQDDFEYSQQNSENAHKQRAIVFYKRNKDT